MTLLRKPDQDVMREPRVSILLLAEGVDQTIAGLGLQSTPGESVPNAHACDGSAIGSLPQSRPLMIGGLRPIAVYPIRVRNRLSAKIAGDEQFQLLCSDQLHATKHGESQWKGLSEIAATSREHFPGKFGGHA